MRVRLVAQQGFDGIAVGGGGPQVNLDWTGSGDDTHGGYKIGSRPTVAIATFDKDGTASFVNGCEESSVQGHLENALATMIGARADPNFSYGRFFSGTIHELQASVHCLWPYLPAVPTSARLRGSHAFARIRRCLTAA